MEEQIHLAREGKLRNERRLKIIEEILEKEVLEIKKEDNLKGRTLISQHMVAIGNPGYEVSVMF